MENLGMTYIRFAYCELEGEWKEDNKQANNSNVDVYEALENNALVNIRVFDQTKNKYYLKKGAHISIEKNVLKFHKKDFSQSAD